MGIKTWIVASLLFGLMGGFSEDASAKDLKLGYIDSNRILTEYKGMADVQAELEKAKLEWDKQTQTREAELDNLREEYDAQSLMWSEKTQQQKQQAIQEKYVEYQRFVNEIIAPGGKFAQRRMEAASGSQVRNCATSSFNEPARSQSFCIASCICCAAWRGSSRPVTSTSLTGSTCYGPGTSFISSSSSGGSCGAGVRSRNGSWCCLFSF